jgi:hypothetical protein
VWDIRDDTCKHSEGVLEPQEQSKEKRHLVIQTEERSCAALLFHKWQVGFEEKRIVVVPN